jgi:hypothetical protein
MYQIVFHRTSTSFKRELTRGQKEDTILKVYPPLKIIVYKEGVIKKVSTRVSKIIETDDPNYLPTNFLIVKIWDGVTPKITCPSVIDTINTGYNLGSAGDGYNNDETIQSDLYYGYQYYMTSGDTYVFDSGGTYVNNVGLMIESQVFDTDLFNYYGSFTNSGSGTTRIYDFDLNVLSTIILSGCPSPISSTYSSQVNKVGILDTYTDKIAIIDTTTITLDGYITLPSGGGYKGIIESDSNTGNMYVISSLNTQSPDGGFIYVVNPSTLTTGTTIPFTAQSSSFVSSMVSNSTNNYIYILEDKGRLTWINASNETIMGSVNLSYSGTYHSMTYDNNNDYLYISNKQSSNVQNIIIFRCENNTEFSQVNSVQTSSEEGIINYNPTTERLWYSCIGNDESKILCT